MTQFQDRRCAACGHSDLRHGLYFGCGQCPDERRCMKFVERDQARPVKVEVVGSKPKALPEPKQTVGIVRVRTTTTVRRRRGLVDWLTNW